MRAVEHPQRHHSHAGRPVRQTTRPCRRTSYWPQYASLCSGRAPNRYPARTPAPDSWAGAA